MTQPQWVSLYIPAEAGREALHSALAAAFAAAGGTAYDPFGIMPGLAYPRAIKLFLAPPRGRWLHVMASPDSDLTAVIAAVGGLSIAAQISSDLVPSVTVYQDGAAVDALPTLAAYLSDADAFAALLGAPQTGASGVGGISSGALPQNVRAMSGGLPARQVERLMNTMTGSISKGDRANAQAALQAIDWHSGAGGWMRALLAHLGADALPDYATVSTAYRTAKRLARNPKATLYPGDAEARDAVPDTLEYLPLFYGWKA